MGSLYTGSRLLDYSIPHILYSSISGVPPLGVFLCESARGHLNKCQNDHRAFTVGKVTQADPLKLLENEGKAAVKVYDPFLSGTSVSSVVMCADHPGLTFTLSLVRTEPSYNQPMQQWNFVSDFAVSQKERGNKGTLP